MHDPQQRRPRLASPSRAPAAASSLGAAQGLGEMMPEQLWETTLNPARRTLRKLTIEDAGEAHTRARAPAAPQPTLLL